MTVQFVDRPFYMGLQEDAADGHADPAALALYAWKTMAPIRRRMLRDGSAATSVIDNLPELKKLSQKFVSEKLPVWRALKWCSSSFARAGGCLLKQLSYVPPAKAKANYYR